MLNDVGSAGYFDGVNSQLPIFHKPTFDAYFEKQYSSDPPTDPAWYAAFNIVLAISCRSPTERTPASGGYGPAMPHIHDAWKYFQNTVTGLTELLLTNTDLMTIQAIMGMVCVVRPKPVFPFLSSWGSFLPSFSEKKRWSPV